MTAGQIAPHDRSGNEMLDSNQRTEELMQLGMIGLGRMGANMVRRLLKAGTSAWSSTCRRKRWNELVQEKARWELLACRTS